MLKLKLKLKLLHPSIALVLAMTLGSATLACDDDPQAAASGPFAVGTAAYHLIDATRPEPATPDPSDPREVMVRAYYPAASAGGGVKAGYFIDPQEGALNAQLVGLPADAFTAMDTQSTLNAPLLAGHARFPVVVFSPGLNEPPALYNNLLEDLASRGYVVFALAHPYGTGLVVFPDGHRAIPPAPPAGWTHEQYRDHQIATWSADQRFVLGWLEQRDRVVADRFSGRLDLGQIGVLGHSVGGAAAAQTCQDEPRVRACANMDGSVGSVVQPGAITRPFLLLRGFVPGPQESTLVGFFDQLAGTAYRVKIDGAGHDTFSDVPSIIERVRAANPAFDANSLLLGTITPARGFALVTQHTAAFFDAHLEGRAAPLLQAPSAHPEITITRKRPQ